MIDHYWIVYGISFGIGWTLIELLKSAVIAIGILAFKTLTRS